MNGRDEANNDPFERIYSAQTQKVSPLKKYGGKIAGGIACSAVVYGVMHVGVVKTGLQWTCEIGGRVLGRPGAAVKLDKLEDKAGEILHKVEQAAKEHKDHPKEGAIAKVIAPVKEAMEVKKTVVEAAKKVEAVKETAAHGVEVVKETGDKVAEALSGAGTQAKAAVVGVGASIAGLAHARADAKEKAAREGLEAHAAVIGLKTDPQWTLARLRAEVIKFETEWQSRHGPNAKCPNPKCRYSARINTKRRENRRCPLCGMNFTTTAALAAWKATHAQNIHVFGR
jgi:hypothetical protein